MLANSESDSGGAACVPWGSFQVQLAMRRDQAYQMCVLSIFVDIIVQFMYLLANCFIVMF